MTPSESNSIPHLAKRLQSARASSGLSTRKVVEALPQTLALSHATIANYEKGRTRPSLEVLHALAKIYGRSTQWFLETSPPLTNAVLRNVKGKPAAVDVERFLADLHRWLEAYIKLEQYLEAPLACEQSFVCGAKSPSLLAIALREHLGLGELAPAPSVMGLLEQFGIRVIETPTSLPLESAAGRLGEEFIVSLNPAADNARCRMLAAHELGHFLLGSWSNGELEDAQAEDRAYEFASHFLLPPAVLQEAFSRRSIVALLVYKQTHGLPLSAMMHRGERDGLLDKQTSKWLASQFSKRGWREQEPGFSPPDRATRMERLLESAVFDRRLRWSEVESVTGATRQELEQRREMALQVLLGSPADRSTRNRGAAKKR